MKDIDIADPTALTPLPRRPTVALALGAGGAKGLAHIGAIEEIEAQGFEIVAIAGCSMGALIGGIYAMGKLDVYRDWVSTLAKFDVLKLLDWTFSGGGFIKGERIMGTLLELIDLEREREVWLTRGSLFDAIRASIAIPTVFRPYHLNGRVLVDGALLNPLPVSPLIRETADYMMAVSVDGPAEFTPVETLELQEPAANGARHRIGEFFSRLKLHSEPKPREPGAFELLNQAMDLMQANLSRLRLAAYAPDLLIQMPRNASTAYEFYRARELIELGRLRARAAFSNWKPISHQPR
jgi:NTE family protein